MAGTTTNFGFDYPTSTDYVKDGATAIQALADDVDARFGNVTTYPNQIVNVVSGVSRPLPFAMQIGAVTCNATSTVAITFSAGRFSVAPFVFVTIQTNSTIVNAPASAGVATTSGVTIANSGNTNRVVVWQAVQMTSAAAAG